MLLHHLISETFYTVGNLLFRQCIGIPIRIDPAPFWANLYLYHYENLRTDRYQGFTFKNAFRFIDDACTINDSDAFNESYQEIYPPELQLKCEHSGDHATFLELDIIIVDGIFVYKLFGKRDAFRFFIVRMPHVSGNIPTIPHFLWIYHVGDSEYCQINSSLWRLNSQNCIFVWTHDQSTSSCLKSLQTN